MADETGFTIDMRTHGLQVQVITLMHGLALEINTGMKATRRALLPIARSLGFSGRTKIQALVWLIESQPSTYVPSPSIAKALAKHGLMVGPSN